MRHFIDQPGQVKGQRLGDLLFSTKEKEGQKEMRFAALLIILFLLGQPAGADSLVNIVGIHPTERTDNSALDRSEIASYEIWRNDVLYAVIDSEGMPNGSKLLPDGYFISDGTQFVVSELHSISPVCYKFRTIDTDGRVSPFSTTACKGYPPNPASVVCQ